MDLLPQQSSLGALHIVEVYAEHDFPCTFACRNERGETFVAVWVDEDDEALRWLYASTSPVIFGASSTRGDSAAHAL